MFPRVLVLVLASVIEIATNMMSRKHLGYEMQNKDKALK